MMSFMGRSSRRLASEMRTIRWGLGPWCMMTFVMGLGGCRLLTIATTSAMLMRLMRRRRCLWSGWRLGRGNGRALGWVARILECLLVFRMRRELLGREHHRAIAVRPFVVLLGSQRIGSNRRRGLEGPLPPVDFGFFFPRLSLRPPL